MSVCAHELAFHHVSATPRWPQHLPKTTTRKMTSTAIYVQWSTGRLVRGEMYSYTCQLWLSNRVAHYSPGRALVRRPSNVCSDVSLEEALDGSNATRSAMIQRRCR